MQTREMLGYIQARSSLECVILMFSPMNTKQKIVAVFGILVVVVGFVLLLGQRTAQAPSTGESASALAPTPISTQSAVKSDTNGSTSNEPVTVDGIVAGISKEADSDTAAFNEEIGDSSAVDGETQALNDVTQSYDENSL